MATDDQDELRGLKMFDLIVLAALAIDDMPKQELAKRVERRPWRVSGSLRRLSRAGLIERTGDTYQTTEEGKRVAPDALAALMVADYEPDMLANLQRWEKGRRQPWRGEPRW